MFGKKKAQDPGRRKGAELMNQMGFGAMPGLGDIDAMGYGDDDDDDDADLEAELAALANEHHGPVKKPKPKQKGPMHIADIEKMAAAGMEDVDDDVSDTEDPDLLAELEGLEDDEDASSPPATSPQIKPQIIPRIKPTQAASPSSNSASIAPTIFEPTIHSSQPPTPAPRTLPSPQKSPATAPKQAPTQSPKVTPTASPKPAASVGAGDIVSLLEERLSMYKQASASAKATGDSSKQRRLDRGIKTLADQLKQAKAGKPINGDDIPPPVAMGASVAVPDTSTSSADPASSTIHTAESVPVIPAQQKQVMKPPAQQNQLPEAASSSVPFQADSHATGNASKQVLLTRRDQYRKVALSAKQEGDLTKASHYVKIAKQFDLVIQALDEGKPVDLSKMPPAPQEFLGEVVKAAHQPQPSIPIQKASNSMAGEDAEVDLPNTTAEEERSIFNAPDAPKTVMEALTQRLEKYKSSEAAAKTEGDSSKARRMGRIIKQYEDAIKVYKAGKPVDFEELPTPPGFGPIPIAASGPSAASSSTPPHVAATKPVPTVVPKSAPTAGPKQPPATAARPAPSAPQPGPSSQQPASKAPQIQRQMSNRKSLYSRQEQQLAFLKERMGEFRQAAMQAKKNHDIELAKKYIRMMKGMEPMINACESGLPVDLSQVPPSPAGSDDPEDKFVIVTAEDCEPTGDRDEVYKTLQEDLVRQIRTCVTNAQHYQKMGDVPAAAKFQKLEQNNRRDLESLKSAHRHGDPAPRFHYESRTFSMVQCNTDLGDTDMELTIIRGIQYNLPAGFSEKDMDTCVKYEFAFPTEEPQTGTTGTIRDSINPEYNETFKLQFNRKSKGLFRFVERKNLKLDILIKRGFFRGDKLLGTVNVKLQPLETQCMIHESYDLVEGRKSVGGKLEVKIRIRDPLKSKQVDEVKEKWLVIDQFIRTAGSKSQAEAKTPRPPSDGTTCMEVLRLEKQMLDRQIAQLKDSLSLNQVQALKHKSALLEEKIELQQKKLREGGVEAWKAYVAAVKIEITAFEQEARQHARLGDVQKAERFLNKKKSAEKEIAAIKVKFPDAF